MFGGSLVDAEWFFGEADTLYRLLDDQRGLAWLEQHRAWISFLSGDMALARDRLNHAADALDKLGDRNGVGWAFGLLAFVEFFERHFAEAEALAEMVIREADQRGDEWAVGMMQTLLADLRLWQGDLGEAANLADQARSRFKKLNDKFGLMQATAPLLRAQIALGQAGAAQRSTRGTAHARRDVGAGSVPVDGRRRRGDAPRRRRDRRCHRRSSTLGQPTTP